LEILVAEGTLRKIGTIATGVTPNNSREARAETLATLGTSEMFTSERTTATEGPQETTGKSRDANSKDASISGNTINKKDVHHSRDTSNAGTTTIAGTPTTTGMSEMLETQLQKGHQQQQG
jgi:hypothetical protein